VAHFWPLFAAAAADADATASLPACPLRAVRCPVSIVKCLLPNASCLLMLALLLLMLMLELLAARIAWMEWQKCPFINFGRVCFHGSLARLVEPQGPLGCYFKFVLLQTVWGIVDSTYHHIACRLPTLAVMATEFIQGF